MMKKWMVVLSGFTIMASTVVASESFSSDKFIGVEVGSTQLQGDIGGILAVADNKVTGIEYGLKIGAQKNIWRTTLSLDFFDKEDQNTEKFIGTFDYFFLQNDDMKKRMTIDPYFGINVGYVNYESTGIDESGVLYGGQAGIVVHMVDSLDVDLSYRYSLSSLDSLDHSGSVTLGLNYFY
jgi:hypothetical protein